MQPKKPSLDDVRLAAEADLSVFIKLVAPEQMLGICHEDVINWWTRQDSKSHQLLLFPRDHGKSRLVAFRAAWELTKDPTLRILYISATANLAEKQLSFIKGSLHLIPIRDTGLNMSTKKKVSAPVGRHLRFV